MTLDYRQLRKEFERKKLEAKQYWKKKEDKPVIATVDRNQKEQSKQEMWEYLTNATPVVG